MRFLDGPRDILLPEPGLPDQILESKFQCTDTRGLMPRAVPFPGTRPLRKCSPQYLIKHPSLIQLMKLGAAISHNLSRNCTM